jgi:excinuclease UvrABC nuclease subunit
MKAAAKNLEFEKAAMLRDRIIELRKDEELVSPTVKDNRVSRSPRIEPT